MAERLLCCSTVVLSLLYVLIGAKRADLSTISTFVNFLMQNLWGKVQRGGVDECQRPLSRCSGSPKSRSSPAPIVGRGQCYTVVDGGKGVVGIKGSEVVAIERVCSGYFRDRCPGESRCCRMYPDSHSLSTRRSAHPYSQDFPSTF